jgi:hypothetical protein
MTSMTDQNVTQLSAKFGLNTQVSQVNTYYQLPSVFALKSVGDFISTDLGLGTNDLYKIIPANLLNNASLTTLNISKFLDDKNQLIYQYDISIALKGTWQETGIANLPVINNPIISIGLTKGVDDTTWYASLTGNMEFIDGSETIAIAFSMDLPSKSFSAKLMGKGINISPFLNLFEVSPSISFSNTTISHFNISGNFSTKTYALGVSIENAISHTFTVLNTDETFSIEEIRMSYHSQNGVATGSLSGQSTFNYKGKYKLDIDMQYQWGKSNDWSFAGRLDQSTPLKLSNLVDVTTLPDAFTKAQLSLFVLSYSTATNDIVVQGEIDNAIAIDNNDFSLSFLYSNAVKSFTGMWQNTGAKTFDYSSLGMANVSTFIDPKSASVKYEVSGNITTTTLFINNQLDIGGSNSVGPDLSLTATKTSGGKGWTATGALTFGSLSFVVDYSKLSGSLITATFNAGSQPLDLVNLANYVLRSFDTKVPSYIPSMELENVTLSYDTATKLFSITAKTAVARSITIANSTYKTLLDVDITSGIDAQTGARTFDGSLKGSITMAGEVFAVEYDLGQDKSLYGSWKTATNKGITFQDIANDIKVPNSFTIPSGIDISLVQIAIEMDITTNTFKFSATTSSGFEAFFICKKVNGSFGFVFGMEMDGGTQLSSLPLVGSKLGLLDFITLSNVTILFSTISDAAFSLKNIALPSLQNGSGVLGTNGANASAINSSGNTKAVSGSAFPAAGGNTFQIQPGIFASLEVDVSANSSNAIWNAMKGLLGHDSIIFSIEIATNLSNSFIQAGLGDPFSFKVGSKTIKIKEASFQMYFDTLAFNINGSISIPVKGSSIDTEVTMDFSDTGIQIMISVVKDSATGQKESLNAPFGLPGVVLDSIGLEMGVTYVPVAMDIGVQGIFNITNQPAGSDRFAFQISLEGEIPNIDYLSVYIAQLSISEIMYAATGKNNNNIPAFLNAFQASDLSLYWCESQVILPNRSVAMPGFGFNGFVHAGDFTVHAELKVSEVTGIEGNAQMSPLTLGPLSIEGKGKGISIYEENVKGNWTPVYQPLMSAVTSIAPPNAKMMQKVAAGGPFVEFSSKHSPHTPYVAVSAEMTLFGLIKEEIEAKISNKGMTFDLNYTIANIFSCDLSVTAGAKGFSACAKPSLNIDAHLPTFKIIGITIPSIHIDVGFDAILKVKVDVSSGSLVMSVQIWGSFWFEGFDLHLPKITLTVNFSKISEIPGLIIDKIKGEAGVIFKDVFDEGKKILDDAKKVADDIGKDAEVAADAVKKEADKVGGDIEQGAKDLVNGFKQGIAAEAKAVSAVADEAAHIASEGAADVRHIAEAADKDIKIAVQEIKNLPGEVKRTVEHAIKDAKVFVQKVDKDIVAFAKAAVQTVKDIAAVSAKLVDDIGADATKLANGIKHAAEAVAHDLDKEAKKVWAAFKQGLKKAGHWISHAGSKIAHLFHI